MGWKRSVAGKAAVALILAFFTLSLLACGSGSGEEEPPSGGADGNPPTGPDIRGRITQVAVAMPPPPGASGSMIGKILVEGEPGPDTGYDKAWVTVMPETRIYRGPEGKEAYFNDLRKGTLVEVFFTGPVMESYPVQATASEIRIVD